jgi:hypothetical protein
MLVDTAAGRYIVPEHKRERLMGSMAAMLRERKAQLRAVKSELVQAIMKLSSNGNQQSKLARNN